MSLGQIARSALGKRFHWVSKIYRAIFINLVTLSEVLSAEIPENALVLDVGGGDGMPLNHLLKARRDISVIMVDIAPVIGGAIESEYRPRVQTLPATELASYDGPAPDAICVMDVVHHVPPRKREAFFLDVASAVKKVKVPLLPIKDVQPGHFRSYLSYIADVYISGDRLVSLIGFEQVAQIMGSLLPGATVAETPLLKRDSPNYCVAVRT